MNVKRVALIVFVVALSLSFTMLGQKANPAQDPNNAQGMDKFEDAHKGMLTGQPDAGQQTGRFTDQVSKSLTGASVAMEKIPRNNFIDELIFGRIEKDGIPHSGLSTDEEFLRRVYLDATGLLPSPETVRIFVASKDADKRNKLIDSLIGSQEFAEQWAWFYGDIFRLMNYAGNGQYAFQYWNKEWLKLDRPYNDVVADMLTGASKNHATIPQLAFLGRIVRNSGLKNRDLTDPDNFAATTNRLDALDEMNVEVSRIFLGVNTDCISCHDGAGHLEPVNLYLSERTRDEFARQSAFFGKLRLVGIYNVGNADNILDNDGPGYNTGQDAPWHTEAESRFPRSGNTYEPAFMLTGEKPRPGMSPRAELARMVTSHPQFSRATVNLIWGKLMTLGFVTPWDGFDLSRMDPKNPPPAPWTIQPTNPELLEALAADFRDHKYSMHHLMKTIMKSNAYQLSSSFPTTWKDSYAPYYARRYVRVMTGPEVADTVAQATGRPYRLSFLKTKVERVKQMTGPENLPGRRGGAGANQEGKDGADITSMMNAFLQGNREAAVPLGNKATTLQAILMMSSGLINDRVLADKDSRVEKLVESDKTSDQLIEELFLATLSRWPTAEEKKAAMQIFPFESNRKRAAENFQWTLMNSIEFVLNH